MKTEARRYTQSTENEQTDYHGDQVLKVMSRYATNRNDSVFELIKASMPPLSEDLNILEFGAGTGEFINRFIGSPNVQTFAVEIDDSYSTDLSKFHQTFRTVDQIPEDMNFIFSTDVLEHIDDDRAILNKIHKKLSSEGILFIYVPARQELYSEFDRRIGHFRRYNKRELKKKLEDSGFEVTNIRYHEALGYLAAIFNKLTSKDGTLDPNAVKVYDRVIVPLTNFIERIITVPIGKSLYAVARKKG